MGLSFGKYHISSIYSLCLQLVEWYCFADLSHLSGVTGSDVLHFSVRGRTGRDDKNQSCSAQVVAVSHSRSLREPVFVLVVISIHVCTAKCQFVSERDFFCASSMESYTQKSGLDALWVDSVNRPDR